MDKTIIAVAVVGWAHQTSEFASAVYAERDSESNNLLLRGEYIHSRSQVESGTACLRLQRAKLILDPSRESEGGVSENLLFVQLCIGI